MSAEVRSELLSKTIQLLPKMETLHLLRIITALSHQGILIEGPEQDALLEEVHKRAPRLSKNELVLSF